MIRESNVETHFRSILNYEDKVRTNPLRARKYPIHCRAPIPAPDSNNPLNEHLGAPRRLQELLDANLIKLNFLFSQAKTFRVIERRLIADLLIQLRRRRKRIKS
jgi:hypothetical protein